MMPRGPDRTGHRHIARLPPDRILQPFFGEAVEVGRRGPDFRAPVPRPLISELPLISGILPGRTGILRYDLRYFFAPALKRILRMILPSYLGKDNRADREAALKLRIPEKGFSIGQVRSSFSASISFNDCLRSAKPRYNRFRVLSWLHWR